VPLRLLQSPLDLNRRVAACLQDRRLYLPDLLAGAVLHFNPGSGPSSASAGLMPASRSTISSG
jgi:hypothetical protein